MGNEQKFQCSGDCLKCMPVQRQYCAAQHAYNNMRLLQKMQESLNLMAVELEDVKKKISAIQDNDAMVFNPNIEDEDTAQEEDGAEE